MTDTPKKADPLAATLASIHSGNTLIVRRDGNRFLATCVIDKGIDHLRASGVTPQEALQGLEQRISAYEVRHAG